VGALYCKDEFPAKETFIKGKEIIRYETVKDSVRDTVICPDGTFVECPEHEKEYVYSYTTDTIKVIDSAALFLYRRDVTSLTKSRDSLLVISNQTKLELKASEKKAKKYFWYLIGSGGLVLLYFGARFKGIL